MKIIKSFILYIASIIKSLSFRIFLIVFLCLIAISGIQLERDYKDYMKDTVDSYIQDMNDVIDDFVLKETTYEDIYEQFKDSNESVALLDDKFNLISLRSETFYPDTLEVSVESDVDEEKTAYLDISMLSDEQKTMIKDAFSKNEDMTIYFEGEETSFPYYIDHKDLFKSWNIYYYKLTYLATDNSEIYGNKTGKINSASMYWYNDDHSTSFWFYDDDDSYLKTVDNQTNMKEAKQIINDNFADLIEQQISLDYSESSDVKTIKECVEKHSELYSFGGYDKKTHLFVSGYSVDDDTGTYYIVSFSNKVSRKEIIWNILTEERVSYILYMILALFIAVIISLWVTRRIRKIEYVTKKITENDFNYRCDEKGSDEISSLSHNINHMSDELQSKIKHLEQIIDEKEQLQKLRNEFTANFTHEMKTPLAILNGNVELMIEDEENKEKYAKKIYNEIDRINSLILQMLDLSKLESGAIKLNIETITLEDIVYDVLDENEDLLINKSIKLDLQSEEDIEINADHRYLSMAITNYLVNACKHSAVKDIIKINITSHRFSIHNTGDKISENMHIWESFVTNDRGGTGLGLALCKRVFELHGFDYGYINEDDGVTFYFDY